jgi:hypothetical protein
MFASDVSVFDYDVVIWDPEESMRRYAYGSYYDRYKGLPSLSEDDSVRLTADAARRRREFVEFINAGRSLIVIVRPPQECYIDTGQRNYSGTGRNRVTTRLLSDFDLLSSLPVSGIHFVKASGSRIEIIGSGPAAELLKKYKAFLSYDAVMTEARGTPLAKVVGTDRVVSALIKTKSGGYLLLLPAIHLAAEDDDSDEEDEQEEGHEQDEESEDEESQEREESRWIPEAPEFQADLLSALQDLSDHGVVARPPWAKAYGTAEQRELTADIAAQQTRIEAERDTLAQLHQRREESEARDQLFLGYGRALEVQVRDVLELLGGTITEPPPGRDDWRVEFPEGKAVLEIKGVTKSAAERHAAQLEKWVASAYEESGEMPKGILVVNTWREKPLRERTEEDFPAQMVPYSKGRGHCLISGLQMFVIRAEVEANPDKAESWRKVLLKTKGPVTKAKNWQSVIQESVAGQVEEG